MKRILGFAAVVVTLGCAAAADARMHGSFHGGGFMGHRPFFHEHSHSRVFFDGGFFFDPFFFPYYYPYYAPYPPPYAYPYPPPDDEGEPPPEGGGPLAENAPPPPADSERASYGLVQLRGVPDGAAVDLDGRFWLTADGLDQRWLAIPDGEHTVAVRMQGSGTVERRVDVKAGKTNVVRFGPFPRAAG